MNRMFKITDHPCFNGDVSHKFDGYTCRWRRAAILNAITATGSSTARTKAGRGGQSKVMRPKEAMDYLAEAMAAGRISVAGIAGPGDPLANPDQTFTTLRLVKRNYPYLLRCLSTNGLSALTYMKEIIRYASHVTLTVNAVDAGVGARITSGSNSATGSIPVPEAAAIMIERQLDAIRCLKRASIVVKVNTVVIPGVNDDHVENIARSMERLSVDMYNAMPLFPVKGTPFGDIPEPQPEEITELRELASEYLPQMSHCASLPSGCGRAYRRQPGISTG